MSALVIACRASETAGHGADAGSSDPGWLSIIHEAPGLPPSDYLLVSEHPGIIKGSVLRTYQQMHLGYPVAGYGFFVETKDGMVLSKNGKLMTELPNAYPTPMSQSAAIEFAWRGLEIAGAPPWLAQPAIYHPPIGQLALVSRLTHPTANDFLLAWCFSFQDTGIGLYLAVTVDAATGQLIARERSTVE